MASVYKKRYPANPISLSTGKPIYFEDLGADTGFLVTSDPLVIAEFQVCMANGSGGIQPSSQEEYDSAVKKKPSLPKLMPGSKHRELQTSGLVLQAEASPAVSVAVQAAAVISPITPLPVPAEPRVGKRK